MATKISKVELQLGRQKISLSLSEAKELHEALDELFGREIVERFILRYIDPWWRRPWITWQDRNSGHIQITDNTSMSARGDALCLAVKS